MSDMKEVFRKFHESHLSMDGYAQYTGQDAFEAGWKARKLSAFSDERIMEIANNTLRKQSGRDYYDYVGSEHWFGVEDNILVFARALFTAAISDNGLAE
jgi:hypothetical protein